MRKEEQKSPETEERWEKNLLDSSYAEEPAGRMHYMKRILKRSEKGGLFQKNSKRFDRVIECLDRIYYGLKQPFAANREKDMKMLTELDASYGQLIESCDSYLDRTSRTTKGKSRQRMVDYIRGFAIEDRKALSRLSGEILFKNVIDPYGVIPTVEIALKKMRTKVIEMGEGKHETVGGEANSLTVLTKEKDGIDGFFSERKIIHRNDAAKVKGSDKVSYENAFLGHLANMSSDTFDSNARNVATSRIAELLGVGRLIARSEMAELRKAGQETGQMGSVMEKAKGERARDVIAHVIGEALYKKGKDKWKSNNPDFQKESSKTMEGLVTGNFQRDMSDLQVLDYLCGQIDRHHDNYFISLNDEGKFDTVQGIDNDLSFGDVQHKGNLLGPHGRRVVSEEGDLFIPHMSRSFAEAIAAVDESMIRFVLADLIETSDVEAFCRRLAALKKAVAKELQKKPGKSKLLGDNEWNDSTLKDFLTAGKSYDGMNEGTANYVGTSIWDHANSAMKVTNQIFANYQSGGK